MNSKFNVQEYREIYANMVDVFHALIQVKNGQGETVNKLLELVKDLEGNASNILTIDKNKLVNVYGLTERQAFAIVAAIDLHYRILRSDKLPGKKMTSSRDVYELLKYLEAEPYEKFVALYLNRSNKVIRVQEISEGGLSGTVADPKKIFLMALEHKGSAIILAHNHPSGNVQPSEADIRLTKKLIGGASLLDLAILDHVIIGNCEGLESFYSFADEGML